VFRTFYRYRIRKPWLRLTGRPEQAEVEADGWAFADADAEVAAARLCTPYHRYLMMIEAWKEAFDVTVSRMEEGDPQRRMMPGLDGLAEVPEPSAVFGTFIHRPADWAAMVILQIETREWREDRLRRARERLGLP